MPPRTGKQEEPQVGSLVSYCHHETGHEHAATITRLDETTGTADLNIHDDGGRIIGGISGVPWAKDPSKRTTKKQWWP